MVPPNPDYPVRLDVDYPDRLSRLLIFVKLLLALPHYFALFFLGIGVYVVLIVSWFATIVTGSYPRGMFDYMVGVQRWAARVNAPLFLLTDTYPPFSLDDDPTYPVRFTIDYPDKIARWRPLLNWLLVIPGFLALYVVFLIAYIAAVIAWFAILITGRNPEALFNTVLIAQRWQHRVISFAYWMTEEYPPFAWT